MLRRENGPTAETTAPPRVGQSQILMKVKIIFVINDQQNFFFILESIFPELYVI